MKGQKVLFSKDSDEWETPDTVFLPLHEEFNFTIDAAATKQNTKLEKFWSKKDDALTQRWASERVWCNPPYSQWQKFVAHAARCGGTAVLLLPARTDTKAFHEYIWYRNASRAYVEVRFIKGRLKFNGSTNSAPFPSMIVIFKGGT